MAFRTQTFELEPNVAVQEVEHNLNTKNLLATFWQNGFVVNASIQVLDESHIAVYNMLAGGTLVLAGDVPAKSKASNAKTGKSN